MRRPPARLLTAIAATVSGALLVACGPGDGPTTAATVNDEVIAVTEVEGRFASVQSNPQFAEQLAADEDGQLSAQVQAQILTELIEARLVEQGARDLGIRVTDEDVAQRRAQLIEEIGGQEAFDQVVEQSGLTEAQVDAEIRNILVRELVQDELVGRLEVDQAEVEALYEQQRDTRFDRARARHILVETEQDALALLERLEDGEDFAALAEEVSLDPGSGPEGGELGEFGRGQMVPEFEQAVFGSEPGDVVGPVETQFGFHVIEVLERMSPEFAEVEEEIRAELLAGQEARAIQEWLLALRREQSVTVNPRFGVWDAEAGNLGGVVPADRFPTDQPEDAPPVDEPSPAPAEP